MGPRGAPPGLGVFEMRKISSIGIRIPVRPVRSLVAILTTPPRPLDSYQLYFRFLYFLSLSGTKCMRLFKHFETSFLNVFFTTR